MRKPLIPYPAHRQRVFVALALLLFAGMAACTESGAERGAAKPDSLDGHPCQLPGGGQGVYVDIFTTEKGPPSVMQQQHDLPERIRYHRVEGAGAYWFYGCLSWEMFRHLRASDAPYIRAVQHGAVGTLILDSAAFDADEAGRA